MVLLSGPRTASLMKASKSGLMTSGSVVHMPFDTDELVVI